MALLASSSTTFMSLALIMSIFMSLLGSPIALMNSSTGMIPFSSIDQAPAFTRLLNVLTSLALTASMSLFSVVISFSASGLGFAAMVFAGIFLSAVVVCAAAIVAANAIAE